MSLFDRPSVRWIVILGSTAFLILAGASLFMRRSLTPDDDQRVVVHGRQSPFDGQRAFADLERIIGFGPRPPGSVALGHTRAYIRREFENVGLTVHEHAFTAQTPIGRKEMVNIWGVVEGTEPGVILLSNHYDTKYFPHFEFVGANDAGSTTAWMIEMARALGPKREGRSVWLMFFDGEEAFVRWTADDSLYGSRALVAHLQSEGRLGEIAAMINVDMIGDCLLGIHRDSDAPKWLEDVVWGEAERLGYGTHFMAFGRKGVEDDHLPFRRAGIDAINLIDFSYGGSLLQHTQTWHTPHDTIDKVCWESLQAVGDVIYHALGRVDAYLNERE